MNRAPFAAWRALFAAGGAPAASHAVLTRMPQRAQLLAPLAASTLVREGRFDVLVRPVELGAALGRRVARATTADERIDEEPDAPGATASDTRRVPIHGGDDRARRIGAPLPDENRRGGSDRLGRRPPLPARDPREGHDSETLHRNLGAPRGAMTSGVGAMHTRSVPSASALLPDGSMPRRPRAPLNSSDATEGAARTPVVIAPPSASVARLLGAVNLVAPSGDTHKGAAPSATSHDASSALERVLERITAQAIASGSARGSASGSVHGGPGSAARSPRSSHDATAADAHTVGRTRQSRAPFNDVVPTNRLQRALPDSTASMDAGSGGFRGLASRALQQSESAMPAVAAPAPRLTHEVRTISDLPLDALDASVADSVTRILQREARRHGIDLAGSGT